MYESKQLIWHLSSHRFTMRCHTTDKCVIYMKCRFQRSIFFSLWVCVRSELSWKKKRIKYWIRADTLNIELESARKRARAHVWSRIIYTIDKMWPNLWTNRHAFVHKFSLIKNLLVKFIHQCCACSHHTAHRVLIKIKPIQVILTYQIVVALFSAFADFLCCIVYECFCVCPLMDY